MKHIKIFGLTVSAAVTLVVLVGAGTASAGGVLCSTTSNPCNSKWATGTILDFTNTESTKLETTTGTVLNTCTTSTLRWKLQANPDSGGRATGNDELIESNFCTRPMTTIMLGGFTVESIAGSSNGTVKADGETRLTITGLFPGENCVYRVPHGTSIGEISEGNPAVFTVNAVATKIEEAADNCPFGPSSSKLTGRYTLTSPFGTTLSVSSS